MAKDIISTEELFGTNGRKSAISSLILQGITDPGKLYNILNYNDKGEKVGDIDTREINDILKIHNLGKPTPKTPGVAPAWGGRSMLAELNPFHIGEAEANEGGKSVLTTAELFAQPKETLSTEELFGRAPSKREPWPKAFGKAGAMGLSQLYTGIARIPATVYDIAALPQNIAVKALGKPELQVRSPDWLMNNPIAKFYEQQGQAWTPEELKKDPMFYFKEGDPSGGIRNIMLQVTANAPNQIARIASAVAGFGGPALVGMGLQQAGSILARDRDKDPATVATNAALQGTIEGAFESIGTMGLFKKWSTVLAKSFGKGTTKEIWKNVGKTIAYSTLGEGNEEFLTSLGQDFSDYLAGNKDALKGSLGRAANALAVGGISGGLITAPSAITAGKTIADINRVIKPTINTEELMGMPEEGPEPTQPPIVAPALPEVAKPPIPEVPAITPGIKEVKPKVSRPKVPITLSTEDRGILEQVKKEVTGAQPGHRYVTRDAEGNVVHAGAEPSDYSLIPYWPEGWGKEIIPVIENALTKGKLTQLQKEKIDVLVQTFKEVRDEQVRIESELTAEGVSESEINAAKRLGEEEAAGIVESEPVSTEDLFGVEKKPPEVAAPLKELPVEQQPISLAPLKGIEKQAIIPGTEPKFIEPQIKTSEELGIAPDFKVAYNTPKWTEIWKDHPELQDQMIEHTRQMKAGETPDIQYSMQPGQAPPQQTFAWGKEEGRIEPGKPKEEGATYSVFDLMNRKDLSLEQLVDALKKAVATHSRDIANLQYVLREDFADLLPARQERPSPTGLKGIGRSGVIADSALLEMKNYMFNPAKHDLKTWLNNNAFAAVSRTIMRMRVATGSAYDAAMVAKYKKVEKGLAEELKRQPTIEEIANKAQFQKNPKNNLLKTQELRDLITFGEGKISYEEGIEYKERLTGRQRVTPPPQYSVSEDNYSSVFDGGLGVTETRFSKVIPVVGAETGPIVFAKEGRRGVLERLHQALGPKYQISKALVKWDGVFYGDKGTNGLIRIRTVKNKRVVYHETIHFLRSVTKFPIDKNIRAEILAVSKYARPFEEEYIIGISVKTGKPTKRQTPYTSYRKSSDELFADFLAIYVDEPGKCKELAPIFTAQIENEMLKNKEISYVITKLREWSAQMQPVIDWVNEQRKIPELDEAFKPWIQRGNLLENLWTDKVADPVINKLKGFWYAFEQTLIGRPISWIFTERKGIPRLAWELLTQRKLLITGQVARAAEELIKPISKLGEEDQNYMWEALQRFDILAPDSLKNTLTEEGRKEFAVWGNESRKLGLLGEEAFWNWAGQYMKWMYTSKEFSENTAKYGAGWMKTLRINLRQFKHRLTDEEMGRKVLEAKYPWHKKNPSQQALIDAYSKADLIKLGQDVRKEMGLMKTVAYPMEKALRYMINSVYTAKALNAIATIPGMIGDREMPNYVQLAKGRGLGNLSGQYVPKTLADEINSFSEKTNILIQILEAPVQVWKAFKVSWNPAAAFSRNPITNALQGWMDNFPSFNPIVGFKGIKTIITKTGGYKAIRDHGQYNKTYNSEELKTLAFLAESTSDHPLAVIVKWAVKIFNTPSEAYGAIEDCGKTILAQYVLDHGGTPMQAVRYANEILFDYSVVSPLVGLVRQGPFPFITWSAKVFPNLVKTAIRRPQKYIFVWLALLVATAYSRRRLGITEKEEESMKPEYLKDRMVFLHPYRDENGNLQWTDLSYFLPWGGWTTPVKGSAIPQIFQIGNPLMTLYNAYVQNYDPFIGQIGKDWMTEEEQRQAKKEYIEQSLAPNISPWGKGFDRIVKAIKKEPVGRYHQVDSLGKVLGGELLGFRTATGSETTTRVTKWEEEQKRAKIEVNRPAKLAWEAYYMDPTPENYKLAVAVNKKVAFKDRQRIKMKAKKDIKLLKRKDSAWQGLSQPQKNKFRKYQRTLK